MNLFERVFSGNDAVYGLTVQAVEDAISKYGTARPVSFPETAYALPCYYGVTGEKLQTLGQLPQGLSVIHTLMTREQALHDLCMSGVATALCAEFLEALRYLDGDPGEEGCCGHLSDAVIRNLGVPLVTGDLPGVAVLVGEAPSAEAAVSLVKSYQAQGILVTLVGGIIDQLASQNFKTGAQLRVLPLGRQIPAVIHVVSVAIRAALIFGNLTGGDAAGLLAYTKERIPAFVNAFAPVDDVVLAAGAGAIALGFPVITNDPALPAVEGALIVEKNTEKFNEVSLEARNIHLKVTKIDLPVAFASAFEGEIIRRKDMYLEVDGSRKDCFELVQAKEVHEIEDHRITLIGPDLDALEPGSRISASFTVEVGGKAMQKDFESVMERQIHSYVNCIEGVMHTGQRDMIRIRISKADFDAGFRLRHIGEVLYAKLKSEYGSIVDRCQVTIVVDEAQNRVLRAKANEVFNARDDRLRAMTDESVDRFYTCTLCQAFSPSHVCIVTPERLGLCGAVSWLDAKATQELNPQGPCQCVGKAHCLDAKLGRFEEVDEAVARRSHGELEHVTLYSLFEDPMTSCGCFECICGVEPCSMGVVITCREHTGMTPLGMTFSEMASMTGGGVQTPGFMGHGKHFISSKKFISADGGPGRIVWMPKMLKDQVREKLDATALELYGVEHFTDLVADETVCTEDPEALLEYLSEVGHPVLSMEPFDL